MSNVIVWDIETVPDLAAFAAANSCTGTDAEIRAAMGDAFPKLVYHSIVCIGALVATRRNERWEVAALGAPNISERSEKDIITGFVNKIDEVRPQMVTFNGGSFDLPVVRYRAMMNGVSAPGLVARPYFHRYTDDAIDLCDILSSFALKNRVTLDELCKVMGLPGKVGAIDGGSVESYVREGRVKEVAAYCENDVVNIYRVWLRYELFRGRLTEDQLRGSEAHLNEFIAAHSAAKPHLQAA